MTLAGSPGELHVELRLDGVGARLGEATVQRDLDGSGALEPLWRGVVDVVLAVLRDAPQPPDALELRGAAGVLALWDAETLGAARPALAGTPDDLVARAERIVAEEPHTWVHVTEGRCALGPLEAYLVARLTRGAWHAVAPEAAWSSEVRTALKRLGVPDDALPDVDAAPPARTDPRLLDGLAVPVLLGPPLTA